MAEEWPRTAAQTASLVPQPRCMPCAAPSLVCEATSWEASAPVAKSELQEATGPTPHAMCDSYGTDVQARFLHIYDCTHRNRCLSPVDTCSCPHAFSRQKQMISLCFYSYIYIGTPRVTVEEHRHIAVAYRRNFTIPLHVARQGSPMCVCGPTANPVAVCCL